ncbi:family 1 encapsulin nanocompartment shell protein [Natranaerobius thermophilus]|nr:family 1 encapsulin nanocompartment shell protein [Natranaerobius thermophilus]
MNLFKEQLAPLTNAAWNEINDRAAQVIKSNLSTRKVFKINGPKGLDYPAVSEGRLSEIFHGHQQGEVKAGLHQVKPLMETRITFKLDRWELDNIERGAQDIDLEPLEDAARKIALFEENAIYNGHNDGQIPGLKTVLTQDLIPLGNTGSEIMESITRGIITLRKAYISQNMTLIVGEEAWRKINKEMSGEPLIERIHELTGSKVVISPIVDGAYLVPYDHDDLELTIGLDFSIGYEHHDEHHVQLFITESFTFRVLDPDTIVKFTL